MNDFVITVCIGWSCSFGSYAHLLVRLVTFACMMHCIIHFCMWICVLDADFPFTHHILDVMITLFYTLLARFGAEIPWRDVRGQYPLHQNSTLSDDLLSWNPFLTPCLINVDDYTSWFHILRLHILYFVLCGFTLWEVTLHDIEGTKPFYREHVSWHDASRGWNGPNSFFLPTCPLFWLCILWIVLSISGFYVWPLTCFVACIGCDWKGCTLSGGAWGQITRYKTLLLWIFWHGFWSSGLCMMHLDNSWLRF